MKKLLFIAILTSIFVISANAQSFPASWIGTYEGMVSSINAEENRSMSMWAKIEFGETEGGRYVVYTDGENSDTQNKYVLTPKATATTLSLFFENCMPVEYGSSEPCTSPFKKGDLLFQLVKTKAGRHNVTHTVWQKLKKDTDKTFFVKKT